MSSDNVYRRPSFDDGSPQYGCFSFEKCGPVTFSDDLRGNLEALATLALGKVRVVGDKIFPTGDYANTSDGLPGLLAVGVIRTIDIVADTKNRINGKKHY